MNSIHSTHRRRPSRWWGPVVLAILAVPACYPFSVDEVQQLDTVVTLRDSLASFSTIGTFVVPDSIVQINEGEEGSIDLNRQFDALILSEVRSQLDALGWTPTSLARLGIDLARLRSTSGAQDEASPADEAAVIAAERRIVERLQTGGENEGDDA